MNDIVLANVIAWNRDKLTWEHAASTNPRASYERRQEAAANAKRLRANLVRLQQMEQELRAAE